MCAGVEYELDVTIGNLAPRPTFTASPDPASVGQTVTFEFRADRTGTFPYYCNLAIDEGCRQMHGELIVRPK